MRRMITKNRFALTALLVAAVPAVALAQDAEVEEATVTLSTSQATLTLDMERGADRTVEFRDGVISVDGEAIAEYERRGELEYGWRDFLASPAAYDARSLPAALGNFVSSAAAGSGPDREAAEALMASVRELLGSGEAGAEQAGDEIEAAVAREARDRLTIVPGALSVEALSRQLERLDRSLSGLGDDVHHSDQLALVLHDDNHSVMSVLDLTQRTLSPITAQGQLGGYVFTSDGAHLAGFTYATTQVGLIDFADMIFVRSEHYRRRETDPVKPVLIGEREGKIALANRRKDPAFLFSALARHLGYPSVPRPKVGEDDRKVVFMLRRQVERLETRIKLLEEEIRGGINLSRFFRASGKENSP